MHEIVIVGAGGFGRELLHWAQDAFPADKFRIKGFLCKDPSELDKFRVNLPILGDENKYDVKDNDRFLFAVGDVDVKQRVVSTLKRKGAQFISLIHPTARVFPTARIGEGVVICPFVTVSDCAEVGDFVTLNYYSSCGHDTKIGPYCILSPYAIVGGASILEERVFMGMHATVAPCKQVGRGSKISANSAAMYDVPPNTFVYGVPGVNRILYSDSGITPSQQ